MVGCVHLRAWRPRWSELSMIHSRCRYGASLTRSSVGVINQSTRSPIRATATIDRHIKQFVKLIITITHVGEVWIVVDIAFGIWDRNRVHWSIPWSSIPVYKYHRWFCEARRIRHASGKYDFGSRWCYWRSSSEESLSSRSSFRSTSSSSGSLFSLWNFL